MIYESYLGMKRNLSGFLSVLGDPPWQNVVAKSTHQCVSKSEASVSTICDNVKNDEYNPYKYWMPKANDIIGAWIQVKYWGDVTFR